jgi:carbon storage regulator
MLVLSRKKNESIIVDDNIVITVVEIRGDKVRLGIEAPREVAIHRSEVRDAIAAAESQQSASVPLASVPLTNVEAVVEEKAAAE